MSPTYVLTTVGVAHPTARENTVRTELTAWIGIAASIVAITLVLAVPGHWSDTAGALILVCVPAGAAVMCWLDSGVGLMQAGLTLVLSLAATAITSTVMIWLVAWHPRALLAFPAACVISCVMRLRRGVGSVVLRIPVIRRDFWLNLVILFMGLGAWAYGVSKFRRQTIGLFGLLASADIWFFLGLALLLGGSMLELVRARPRIWLLGTYLAALIVAIHATVPIVYGVPEYAWVYKHIGITQALGHYGHVTDPSNIYQEWRGAFRSHSLSKCARPCRSAVLRCMGATRIRVGRCLAASWHFPSARYGFPHCILCLVHV